MNKPCNRCGEVKPLTDFPKNAASPDGRYSLCKVCRSKKVKEYRARPEILAKEKIRLAESYKANREVLLDRRKARYIANKPAERARQDRWLNKNRDHHRQVCRDWAKRNPLKTRALVAKRRALLRGNGGSYSAADVANLMQAQNGLCNVCYCGLGDYHVDHVIPISRGGINEAGNLQLLCPTCNRSKGNKLPHEFEVYRAQKQQIHSHGA